MTQHTDTSRDAILGFAEGYGIEQLEMFVTSLRRTSFAGKAALFVDHNLPKDVGRYLQDHDIQAVRAPWKRTIYRYVRKANALQRQIRGTYYSPTQFAQDYLHQDSTMARYAFYKQWLTAHGRHCENVLFTDVRDVVFQCDPFAQPVEDEICLFAEPGPTIVNSGATAKWLRRSYGAAVVEQLADRPVICAGVMCGTRDGMLRLVNKLTAVMAKAPSFWSLRFGLDQAALNLWVHTHDVPGLTVFPHLEGRIAHLAWADSSTLKLNDDGQVVGEFGQVVPLLHQYDRHPRLNEQVQQRYLRAA
ncbi:MAG: hypothetical protein R3E01_08700 [Pirellulaceae bacterium]|nr:hypothetical protein [Planctomycetales bacterium]